MAKNFLNNETLQNVVESKEFAIALPILTGLSAISFVLSNTSIIMKLQRKNLNRDFEIVGLKNQISDLEFRLKKLELEKGKEES